MFNCNSLRIYLLFNSIVCRYYYSRIRRTQLCHIILVPMSAGHKQTSIFMIREAELSASMKMGAATMVRNYLQSSSMVLASVGHLGVQSAFCSTMG